jgi:hypothetical protein
MSSSKSVMTYRRSSRSTGCNTGGPDSSSAGLQLQRRGPGALACMAVILLAATALHAGCSTDRHRAELREQLNQAKTRWQSLAIDTYVFVQAQAGMSLPEPTRVAIENGVTT